MTLCVSFIGHHNAGKTTLIAQVVTILLERGYRIGAVKHSPRLTMIDSPNSDSQRLREAGAEQTLLISEDSCALFWDTNPEEPVDLLVRRLFADYDIVLLEGYKYGPFPRIEVYRRLEAQDEPLAGKVEVIAVITKDRVALPDTVETLSPQDPDRVATFIEDMIKKESAK
jgi:molybdopterin-guanine dinucleotide biosynthesis protein MobB